VLWATESGGPAPVNVTTALSLGKPSDGDATPASPFWPDLPAGLIPSPLGSFPDGNDGWVVTGTEVFADQSVHVSVWSVSTAGSGARIGCGPALPKEDQSGFVETAAMTPDAVYVLAAAPSTETLAYGYTLVRLDRPVAIAPVAP
jgi:hypothetical protein